MIKNQERTGQRTEYKLIHYKATSSPPTNALPPTLADGYVRTQYLCVSVRIYISSLLFGANHQCGGNCSVGIGLYESSSSPPSAFAQKGDAHAMVNKATSIMIRLRNVMASSCRWCGHAARSVISRSMTPPLVIVRRAQGCFRHPPCRSNRT